MGTLDICHPEGKIQRSVVSKGTSTKELYKAARKSHWGGLWPVNDLKKNDKN